MSERLAKAPDVVAGDPREPVCDAPVDVDALLFADLAGGSRTDQVVRQPDHSTRFDGDPTHNELARRLLSPIRAPAVESGRVHERERPPGDREKRDERSRVQARATQ